MPLVQKLLERRQSIENPSTPLTAIFDILAGPKTKAGVRMGEHTAVTLSAVYAATRVHTDTVASVPLIVYRRLPDGGRERAPEHRIYDLLRMQPNPLMSSFVWREMAQGHLSLWGNSYHEIERNGGGDPIALWPLLPDRTRVEIRNGAKWIVTQLSNGQDVALPPGSYLHIPGFGFDGIRGRSVIGMARESLGLTEAAEQYGARFFGQGAKASGVLEHPGQIGKEAAANLRQSWAEVHGGLSNSHRVAVLEEGMKFAQTSIPPEDSQFLETRQFQVTEVARWFKVPPHKIMDLTRSTFSNIEAQNIEFHQDTAFPWYVRWEQQLQLALLTPAERNEFFIEFLADAILRGDTAARGDFYTKLFAVGGISPNEIRAKENMNPIDEGGDQYFVPLNMVPVDQAASLIGDDDSSTDEEDARAIEQRAAQSRLIAIRQRQRAIQLPLMEAVTTKILAREAKAVRREIKKAFSDRAARDFREWLNTFYADYDDIVVREFGPILRAFAETVASTVLAAQGADELDRTFAPFVVDFIAGFGRRWAAISRKELTQILNDTDPADVVEALEARVDHWEDVRAEQTARRETTRAGEAFGRAAWVAVGVQVLRWVAIGENCPFCSQLDGRVVGTQEAFVRQGQQLLDGDAAPLTPRSNVLHPPIHDGCDCLVIGG